MKMLLLLPLFAALATGASAAAIDEVSALAGGASAGAIVDGQRVQGGAPTDVRPGERRVTDGSSGATIAVVHQPTTGAARASTEPPAPGFFSRMTSSIMKPGILAPAGGALAMGAMGFMIGGPLGALTGIVIGGLLGFIVSKALG